MRYGSWDIPEGSYISFTRIARKLEQLFPFKDDFQYIVTIRLCSEEYDSIQFDEAAMRRLAYVNTGSNDFLENTLTLRNNNLIVKFFGSCLQKKGTYTLVDEPNTKANEVRSKFND